MIPTRVLRATRSGFGLPRGSVRVLSTRFGKSCLVHRAHDGTMTQLRLVRELPGTAERLTSEHAWLTHLSANHHLAVPSPRLWCETSRISPPLPDRDGAAWRAMACSWVAGRHLDRGLDANALRRAGALLAQLHRANADAPHEIAHSRPEWWVPRLFELATTLRDVVHDRGTFPADVSPALAAPLRRAHDAIVAAHAALPVGPAVSGLIHTDAHWQNLRFLGHRVGLVDFEDFANGRFMFDVACLWEKVEERRNSERLLDAVLDGYHRVAPLPAGHLRDLHVMLAFRRFDYVGWVLSWPRRDLRAWGPTLLSGAAAYIDRHLQQ